MSGNDTSVESIVGALRSSLRKNSRLAEENDRLRSALSEPIAIVGIGCRFPGGVRSPEDLWRLLADGTDAIGAFPADRNWNTAGETAGSYARVGGFLHDGHGFDADFFGISPREAAAMDPQQRLLLETAWETIESAGIAPDSLKGSRTGVFAGTTSQDYAEVTASNPDAAAGFGLTGAVASVLSGRIAYALGLEGPAVTIDTACSSSLVALHLAVQALRRGECDYALAGGATFMSTPVVFAEFSQQGGLAADGRCKPFAGAADGTGWGEGAGLLLVERLSDARRNGHDVLAVVRGSAVNQDGASNGLTAPNGPSQQRVIRSALADAGLTPGDVDAVEAHGTGTTLGDPIEAHALLATYGDDRPADRPLHLGSVKSNIGHTQAAAGVAGVIKMVMALRHNELPATLHVDEPTPKVDWSSGALSLLTDRVEWPDGDRPRRAGVSSFGISGTNAHVVLEQPPVADAAGEEPPPEAPEAPSIEAAAVPWVLSAKSAESLRGQAERLLASERDRADVPAVDVGWSLAATRARFDHRAVVTGSTRAELLDGLSTVAEGRGSAVAASGRAEPGGVALVFSGQGAQWPGMTRGLYEGSAAYRKAFDEVCAILDPLLPGSLAQVVFAAEGTPQAARLDRTDFTQPALFAVEVALHALVSSCGVRADVLAGHSVGEIAAAWAAGVLSLRDASVLVAARGRLMQALPGDGAMVSLEADEADALRLLDGLADVGIGAVNGPASVVVSGAAAGMDVVEERARESGVKSTRLRVGHGFHSPLMDPMLDEFAAVLRTLEFRPPRTRMVSAVTGGVLGDEVASPHYWVRHARETVRYHDALGALAAEGVRTLVEVGPDGVLSGLPRPSDVAAVPLMRRPRAAEAAVPEPTRFLRALAQAHTHGVDVDWRTLLVEGRKVTLPTYAFDRKRFWIDPMAARPAEDTADAELWHLVESGDVDAVARALDVGDEVDVAGLVPALSSWRRRRRFEDEVRSWRHQVSWTPVTASGGVAGERWLVVMSAGSAAPDLTAALAGGGARVVECALDGAVADRSVLAARLAEAAGAEPVDGVVSLLPLAEDRDAADSAVLVQALGDAGVGGRLWCVTQGAVSAGTVVSAPQQTTVWGLGRVVALEHPERWGGLIDLPSRPDGRTLDTLCGVLGGDEDQLALRGAGVLARRLVRANAPTQRRGWRPRGTVLLTGGTGGLGRHLTRWLLDQGAQHVLIISRRGLQAPGASELRAEHGGRVTIVACDAAERDQLATALTHAPQDIPLTAVVHAAGVVGDGPVDSLTAHALATTARPKATAAWNLHELTRDIELDAFVMFSSAAGLVGAGGLAAYGAANAFLDGFAEYRHGLGLPATAVAWGPWAGSGMAVDADATEELRAQGMRAMEPASALAALRQVLDTGQVTAYVADADWDRFAATFTIARPSALFDELVTTETAEDSHAPTTAWADMPEGDRVRAARELVRTEAAAVLGHADATAVDDDRPFRDLGFDSLTAVELRDRIATRTGLDLPPATVFDYPTVPVLAGHIIERLVGAVAPEPVDEDPRTREMDEPVAIVGVGCRFPGGVRSPEDLWRLVSGGSDAIGAFPTDRGWDSLGRAGDFYARVGGFLYDGHGFDADFFGISPREAAAMDPQQRLLLETAWEAIESAGIAPDSLKGSATGVFAGTTSQDYAEVTASNPDAAAGFGLTGAVASVLSGRIAYALGLEGPALTVDTACSSSLVALHLAAQALRRGECSLALAGGVTFMSTPGVFAEFSRQGGLAADGRCKSFAGAADGTGWGEGVGLLLVERLSDARRNGHDVLAVVRGSAVNQDGASNGLTAPNGPSQQRVIRSALADAGLTPGDVDAVEAHGTGTTLGDPIEAHALLATYGHDRPADRPLLLGSVKSNIGHTQAAAGIAGVIKMVMALRHGELPPTLHAEAPTSRVDWSAGGLSLLTEPVEWPDGDRPRRAGVSSFGISGTNAHVILEQPPVPAAVSEEPAPGVSAIEAAAVPWVLSAKTPAALRDQAQRLLSVLDRPDVSLTDVAWSLARTRARFDHRAVVVGADRAELLEGLSAVAEGRTSARVVSGRATPGRVGLVFSGQGAQWAGMARGLYETSPVFADAFNEVCAAFDGLLPRPLADVIFAEKGTPQAALLDRTDFTQPALFAVEVALHALAQAFGVRPDVLAGHSIGEISAAHIAGVLSLQDACTLVAARGRLMAHLPSTGAMLSLEAGEDHASELVDGLADVGIGAVNGPASVVVSGAVAGVEEVEARAHEAGIRATRLRVGQGFHSPLMDPMLEEFAATVAELDLHPPTIPLVSTVTGRTLTTEEATSPGYWVRHARDTVRYHDAVQTIAADGIRTLIEIGPDSPLSALTAHDDLATIPLMCRPRTSEAPVPEPERFTQALAKAHTRGVDVDWAALLGSGRRVPLPTYAFDRKRYWIDPVATPNGVGEDDARLWDAVDREDANGVARVLDADRSDVSKLLPMLSDWRRRRLREKETRAWRYGVSWTPAAATGGVDGGRWLVVTPVGPGVEADTTVRGCVAALAGRAAEVHEVEAAADRSVLAARLAEAAGAEPVDGVVSLLSLGETRDAAHLAVLVQALGDAGVGGRLWCVTQGAVSAGTVVSAPQQTTVWGLGRVVALEHPERWGGLIDLPSRPDGRTLDTLCGALGGDEDQLALRGAGVLARRLVRANAPTQRQGWRPRGTVLLTGGTGGLGHHLTRWLLDQGAQHVLIISRRGLQAPGASELRAEHGGRVTIVACDAAERDQLATALTHIPHDVPLTAVVHAAGVVGEGPVETLSIDDFKVLARPKATAAWNLHDLTRGLDLDAFVMFSSGAGVVGAGGLGAYGAANAFLDGFAEYRHGLGLPATAVAWGSWADSGMAVDADATEELRAQGMRAMAPASALAALRQVLDTGQVTAYVADLDLDRFAATFTIARPNTLFDELVTTETAEDSPAPTTAWTEIPERDRVRAARELVRAEAAAVLGHTDATAVDDDRPFRDLGFDSLTAVELRDRIAARTGLRLTAAAVFDHPTPVVLAGHLLSRLTDSAPAPTVAVSSPPATEEPIAIVGIGCRYPGGVGSAEDLWRLVADGVDAVGAFPTDRGWAEAADGSHVRVGGFLYDGHEFDPGFFGMSPREAVSTDPQQRLLLETAWEAIESAGIAPDSLKGSATGVFTGTTNQDYAEVTASNPDAAAGFGLTGSVASVLSGRVAYALGLEGPALTVDTACSSSLVALHLAAQALRRGECTLALAGGVTFMSTPVVFTEFHRQQGLAGDGRCKSFAGGADGTGFSEGVGLVLVERLSDALRNGHEVLAVVRGSAVNQDGASNGLTAPNGPSQQRVIRSALADAGLDDSEVDAVEAHGTGTTLGDPIEAEALLATYGRGRSADRPLHLGSIKSNIGHTQAAAGVAGVIKMVMALRHGRIPKSLHIDEPSPGVDWSAGSVSLLTGPVEWPDGDRPRRAGVSSFGISGTNAHLILEEPPAAAVHTADPGCAPVVDRSVVPWVLSAKSAESLRGQGERLLTMVMQRPELQPSDVGWSLTATRARFDHRAVVVGADRAELLEGLSAVAEGRASARVVSGRATPGRVGLVFSGQGAQWAGMARGLYESSPVFADAFNDVCAAFDGLLPRPLADVTFAGANTPQAALLDRTDFTQPALFAVEVALHALVQACGVRPDVLAGHSIGEISAAHIAGVLSLRDACTLVAARGRLMAELPSTGAMLSLETDEPSATDLIHDLSDIGIGAVNGPASVVVSGDTADIDEVRTRALTAGIRTTRLRVGQGFHSPLMDPMLDDFAAVVAELDLHAPSIPLVSTVTGRKLTTEEATSPRYWVRHARDTVRYHDAVRTIAADGIRTLIEIGPDGVLSALPGEALTPVPVMRRPRSSEATVPEPERFVQALAKAHVSGTDVDWTAVLGSGRPVPLPTYAFHRRRYWIEPAPGTADVADAGLLSADHPLLGAVVETPDGVICTGRLSRATHAWLADHAVAGSVVVPGTAVVEMVSRAGDEVGCGRIGELVLQAPVIVPEQGAVQVRVVVGAPNEDGERDVALHSRPESAPHTKPGEWTVHATGRVTPAVDAVGAPLGEWPPADAGELDLDGLYPRLAAEGLVYGPVFQGLRSVWRRDGEIFAEVELPTEQHALADDFLLHPALLDAALHALVGAVEDGSDTSAHLPFTWSGVRVRAVGATALRVRMALLGEGTVAIEVFDTAGEPVADVEELTLRPLSGTSIPATDTTWPDSMFSVDWIVAAPADRAPSTWAVLGDADELAGLLRAQGVEAVAAADVDALPVDSDGTGAPDVVVWRCPGTATGGVPAAAHEAAAAALSTVRKWLAEPRLEGSRLAVVTRNAVAAREGEAPDLTLAPVWGLVRSAQSENPDRFVLVDIDTDGGNALVDALAAGEPQVAVRDGAVLVPRVVPWNRGDRLALPDDPNWRLDAHGQGTIDDLAVVADAEQDRPLREGEVRVRLRAAGLNFRDVLMVLGMYPGEISLGSEGAGIVTETGPGVTALTAGDRVSGYLSDAFGPTVIADHRMLTPIPDSWSWARAASIPIVSVTALWGLRDLAGLARGESVLIHAGAGGVGMAAIQIARHLGAEVFATASEAKWDTLRELGLDDDHIASSRTLDFEDEFLKTTDNRGVDVVLNSLSGDFTDASLRLLPRGGRFIEIGKRDIRDPENVAAAHPGVRYHAFDSIDAGPDRIGHMLTQLIDLHETGALRPLPVRTWPLTHAKDAFRHLSQAKHTGKLVLTLPEPPLSSGTVLVTGGTGHLGGVVARHAAASGAAHVLVVSRRGADAPGADDLRADIAASGARVTFAACDAADRDALAAVLRDIPADLPLRSVVHAAGVLDDGLIPDLTPGRLAAVMRPKVDAAWHLHELTRHHDLDAFVLFSSIAGTAGGPGQANYAAANTFLDALAHHRHARGLPATSLAWGPWADDGMAAALADVDRARITRTGLTPLTDEQGLHLLDTALRHHGPLAITAHLDTTALTGSGALWSSLSPVPARRITSNTHQQSATGLGRLTHLPPKERLNALEDLVRTEAAAVLGHPDPGTLDRDHPFRDLGFDSLTAVELRNRLNTLTALRLPPSTVFDHPTVAVLADHLDENLFRSAVDGPTDGDELDRLDALLATIADRGEDSVLEKARQRMREFLRRDEDAHGDPDDTYLSEVMNSASFSDLKNLVDEQFGYGDIAGPGTGSIRHEGMDDV
ncbi:type I polyketide synthase [Nocardiopsis mangrovi]|uniref:Type I polyketide synthase n=1 Tax=Nocardiopsis mangrovi TaxID=1179818 RepID=A0ABV9DVX0_9ACTN